MLRTPLGRYRVLAYIVGVCLVVLVFAGVPLQVWAHVDVIAKYVGMLHGFLYLVYCVACLEVVLRYRLGIVRLALMAAAGFVPFLSFVMERHTTHLLQTRDATPKPAVADLSAPAN